MSPGPRARLGMLLLASVFAGAAGARAAESGGGPGNAVEEARALARAGDARARDKYLAALSAAPSDVGLRVEFAEYLWGAGNSAEAEEQMDWLLAHGHPRPGFLRYYGLKLFDAGSFEKAARVLGDAAREGSADADLLYCLGAARLETGDFAAAEDALGRAIESAPRSGAASHLLGRLFHLTGRLPESVAALRRAADADPASSEIWLDLAQALADSNQAPEAERACRLSIERHRDRAAAHLTLAKVLRTQGKNAEANLEFATSRTLYGREEERTEKARAAIARAARGWELIAQNRPSDALAQFETAPESSSAWKGRAEALRRLGRPSEAIGALERAKALAPDDRSIDYAIERLRAGSSEAGR